MSNDEYFVVAFVALMVLGVAAQDETAVDNTAVVPVAATKSVDTEVYLPRTPTSTEILLPQNSGGTEILLPRLGTAVQVNVPSPALIPNFRRDVLMMKRVNENLRALAAAHFRNALTQLGDWGYGNEGLPAYESSFSFHSSSTRDGRVTSVSREYKVTSYGTGGSPVDWSSPSFPERQRGDWLWPRHIYGQPSHQMNLQWPPF
nr:uncharacterized protein LOC123752483 [Procambarus clarkii]